MPAALLEDALASVDEDQGEVSGRGSGHHVAGVLDVTRGVRDDELAFGRGEVSVGHVDRDALLALGPKTVGEQGQVDVVFAAITAGAFDGLHLVLEHSLGVIQEAADQGALAVIDASGRRESEDVHV